MDKEYPHLFGYEWCMKCSECNSNINLSGMGNWGKDDRLEGSTHELTSEDVVTCHQCSTAHMIIIEVEE